jgi:prenyl protein peptidase
MEIPKYPTFITPSAAWLLSAFFAASYVGSLYIFPAGRLKFNNERVEVGRNAERARTLNERWRNDPATIRARLSGVALSTVLSCFVIYAVVTKIGSWKVGYLSFLSLLLNTL